MTGMRPAVPADPAMLGRAVADSLVVAADSGARQAGLSYWHRSRPWVGAVVRALRDRRDPDLRRAGEHLLARPADPAAYWALRALLERRAGAGHAGELFAAGWRAECNSRIGYHLGPGYQADEPEVTAGELNRPAPARPATAPPAAVDSSPAVLVVIPFRDRDTGGQRARNLLACLLALADQDYPRDRYRVVVVETDDQPRWREIAQPRCDRYLFAPRAGAFNKSWAVNVGVVQAGDGAELLSILDADVLCDRAFLSRNAARFGRPGTGGHLAYRDMSCLDPPASRFAIRTRIHRGRARVPWDRLRAFQLRRPPGACVWVRRAAFLRVGGMDERYEGWGGEDNDLVGRLDLDTPFDTFHDDLVHLHHPPSSRLVDGRGLNDHIPPLSWPPHAPIGQLSGPGAGTSAADERRLP